MSPLYGNSGSSPLALFNLHVSVTSAAATVSQTQVGSSTCPASGSAWKYAYAASSAEAQTQRTPGTAAPRRRSTLFTVFQVSPTQRCRINARIVRSQRCPACCQTRSEAVARRGATTRIHMMGKKTPGGVQPGMTRSLNPPVACPCTALCKSGRELSRGEKIRDRMLMPKNRAKTNHSGGLKLAAEIAASRAKNAAAIRDTCSTTAAEYLSSASVSSSLVPAALAAADLQRGFG
mmetsp:Transcript_103773/g.293365  ORF Transcript_103773/g.293365 Transcript_103773/m.293365 type:complete len:234 (-) Transcript_103773:66-767(-)